MTHCNGKSAKGALDNFERMVDGLGMEFRKELAEKFLWAIKVFALYDLHFEFW
jgi:hypothetical protein